MALEDISKQLNRRGGTQSSSPKSKPPEKPQLKEQPKAPEKTQIDQFLRNLRKQSSEIPGTGGQRFKKEEIAEILKKVRESSAKRGGTDNFYEKNKKGVLGDLKKGVKGETQSEKLKRVRQGRWLKKHLGNK